MSTAKPIRRGGRMNTWRSWVPCLVVAIVLLAQVRADGAHLKENPRKHRIVYHLDEAGLDKAKFVFGNIPNHVSRVGGGAALRAPAVLVHRPALEIFMPRPIAPPLQPKLGKLAEDGTDLGA